MREGHCCLYAGSLSLVLLMSTDIEYHTTTVLRLFFRDHPGEQVPEENFWTLWCKGRLTVAETPTIRLGATPSGLTSAHLHHPPFLTDRMPFLLPNQQCQNTEGLLLLLLLLLFSRGNAICGTHLV